MPAAIGIATRAPIIPRKAPPITTAKTVRTGRDVHGLAHYARDQDVVLGKPVRDVESAR